MEEQRRFVRVPFRQSVRFATETAEPVACVAKDLSEGGVRVQSEDFVPLNAVLNVDVELSAEQRVVLPGRVVWVQKVPHGEQYQLGLQFSDAVDFSKAREALQRYIVSRVR